MKHKIKALTDPSVVAWIKEHAKANVYDLVLQKSPFPEIEMKTLAQQIAGRQIAAKKLPMLANKDQVIFPPKVNLEQTSSATTAAYKSQIIRGKNIVDITGGLGIDCLYFSNHFKDVFHIEQNATLQVIASHNFKVLNKYNIKSYHADGIRFLEENPHLDNVLFVDPARRNAQQKKVFLLEDLTPNILEHIENWNNRFKEVWIKLSPMIDLTYLIETIPQLSQIHLVAVKNELKEVLIAIKKEVDAQITAVNLETNDPIFNVSWQRFMPQLTYTSVKKYIYEPNAAIQKSGYNNFLTTQFALNKLHPNTQLFTSNQLLESFPGRIFKVIDSIHQPKKELKGKSIQAIHRNFPENLNTLKKKYKFTTDGTTPILFTQSIDKVSILKADLIQSKP